KVALSEKVTLRHAAELAGCGAARFLEICDELKLPIVVDPDRIRTTVPTEHIGPVENFWNGSIEVSELRKVLGFDQNLLRKLIDNGDVLVRLKSRIPVSSLLDRDDAKLLIDAISQPLEEVTESSEDFVTLRQVVSTFWISEPIILKE